MLSMLQYSLTVEKQFFIRKEQTNILQYYTIYQHNDANNNSEIQILTVGCQIK